MINFLNNPQEVHKGEDDLLGTAKGLGVVKWVFVLIWTRNPFSRIGDEMGGWE